jgi:hypothetical protein
MMRIVVELARRLSATNEANVVYSSNRLYENLSLFGIKSKEYLDAAPMSGGKA